MATRRRRFLEALAGAVSAGFVCSFAFFILGMSSGFLVTGDGHASRFTYFMLALIDIPIKLFDFNKLFDLERVGKAIPASMFWGTAFGLVAFVYRLLRPEQESGCEKNDVSI